MAIDVSQLQERGVYESRLPLDALLQDLERIGKLQAETLAFRKKLRIGAGFVLLAGVAIAIAAASGSSSAFGFSAFLVFALAVALFVYSFIYGRKLCKHSDRLVTMRELSKVRRQDAHAKSPFAARLAIVGEPKLIREEAWTPRKNGKQKFFAEEFLSLEGELLDGTVLTETITELSRKRTYSNPRGKIKSKTRLRYLVTVRFAYPPDRYGDARQANDALHEEIRVPSSAAVRDTRVSEKSIVIKALVKMSPDVLQTCAMLSMGAYRILNLARRMAAKAPGQAS